MNVRAKRPGECPSPGLELSLVPHAGTVHAWFSCQSSRSTFEPPAHVEGRAGLEPAPRRVDRTPRSGDERECSAWSGSLRRSRRRAASSAWAIPPRVTGAGFEPALGPPHSAREPVTVTFNLSFVLRRRPYRRSRSSESGFSARRTGLLGPTLRPPSGSAKRTISLRTRSRTRACRPPASPPRDRSPPHEQTSRLAAASPRARVARWRAAP